MKEYSLKRLGSGCLLVSWPDVQRYNHIATVEPLKEGEKLLIIINN